MNHSPDTLRWLVIPRATVERCANCATRAARRDVAITAAPSSTPNAESELARRSRRPSVSVARPRMVSTSENALGVPRGALPTRSLAEVGDDRRTRVAQCSDRSALVEREDERWVREQRRGSVIFTVATALSAPSCSDPRRGRDSASCSRGPLPRRRLLKHGLRVAHQLLRDRAHDSYGKYRRCFADRDFGRRCWSHALHD